MTIVIPCAGDKVNGAASLMTKKGEPVKFIANPPDAPPPQGNIYALPDDPSDVEGRTWRQVLVEYNRSGENPLGLKQACHLYKNEVYRDLATSSLFESMFILSAGWGLIRSDYLLPAYDITFSSKAKRLNRRTDKDRFQDFCQLTGSESQPVVLLGTKSYCPLFDDLTKSYNGKIVAFQWTPEQHLYPFWQINKYSGRGRTNWQYACARQLLDGSLTV